MSTRPQSITGGCLCGSVRYILRFSTDEAWPPDSATCQCTMCRKWTASLLCQFLVVRPSQFESFPFNSETTTYTEYESSPKSYRGFCSKCGSSLIWRSDNQETMDLFLGSIDEKWLVHEKELGKQLATPNQYQYWCENAVKGVSDVLHGGRRFKQGNDGSGQADEIS